MKPISNTTFPGLDGCQSPRHVFSRHRGRVRALCWLVAAVISLLAATHGHAQSYGPPAILFNGAPSGYGYTGYDASQDVSYDAYSGFTIDQNYNVTDWTNVLGTYDHYGFTFSVPGLLAATSDGRAIRPPPLQYATVTISSNTIWYYLAGTNVGYGNGSYTEELNYQDVSNSGSNHLTVHRSFDNGSLSGDVSGTQNGDSFSGTFDPGAFTATITTDSQGLLPIDVLFSSAPQPPPRQGPPFISWNGLLLTYASTDGSGNDYYHDVSTTTQVVVNNGSATSGSGPAGAVSGSYSTTTQTFTVNVGDFFAMDDNRNPIGLPAGLILVTGYSGFGTSILVADSNSPSVVTANYTYQQVDGNWCAKYIGLPVNHWFVVADNANPPNYNSQIYVTSDTTTQDRVINAVAGWPLSNSYPPQLYVNGVVCPLQWDTNYVTGSDQYTGGGASYATADNSVVVTLNWWSSAGSVSWWWSSNTGPSGGWDGVSTFTGVTESFVVSLNMPVPNPVHGPAGLALNGVPFVFNGALSGLWNADVYDGSGYHFVISPDNSVRVYAIGSSSVLFSGTYDPASRLFNFGSANIGTVTATNGSTGILGTSPSSGNLDIPGSTLSLGSWLNAAGDSVGGFVLSFNPIQSSEQYGLIRFASTLAQTDWQWSRASVDGSTDQRLALELDLSNRLLLYSPGGDSGAKIILDPVNGASFKVPIRMLPAGDLNMGNYQLGPQP